MAPFDSGFSTKISPLIEGQVPDYIQGDHPQFVQFLKSYYEFLEAAELTVDGIINNLIQETTASNFILDEAGGKVVAETGVGTTGKFIEGETITGGTSEATATVLVDLLSETVSRMFISSNQKFEVGETITGTTSGATATVEDYRPNPVNSIQKLLDFANTDNTTAKMLDEMQRQFMAILPNTLASGLSKRNLLKNIKDLYTAKGTSEGHKLFLRLMFDENADVFYPTQYMLRTSDGNWIKSSTIRCRNFVGADGDEVIGQYLTGQTSGATVFVSNAIGFAQGADSITEFEIDLNSVIGTFIDGETLTANGVNSDVEQRFTIQKIVTSATVNEGGTLYSTGDTIALDSSIGNGAATAQVNAVSTGSVDRVIIVAAGSNYRVGDTLIFSPTSAEAVVSVIGGSILLEDYLLDNTDGYEDYLTQESATNFSYPEFNFSTHDNDIIVLEGTDSSSTDEDWRLVSEYATPRSAVTDDISGDKIVYEEGVFSTYGEIAGVQVIDSGTGYSSLPTITITSIKGTSASLIPTTNDIGGILDVSILDAGFNYKSSPNATVPTNFVLSNISGTFSADNTLNSHTGTVTSYDSANQILKVDIEDQIRMRMEQEGTTISQNVELEVNTELQFSRITGNAVLESGVPLRHPERFPVLKHLNNQTEGLSAYRVGIEGVDLGPDHSLDMIVTDGADSKFVQISLENEADDQMSGERIHLEEQRITSDDIIIDGPTKAIVINPRVRGFGENLLLEGTAVGDSILLNATDGSDTDAGDEILLDRTTAAGADAGDKLLQQSDNEGEGILYEPHNSVGNYQQRKDKFQLDGTKVQLLTNGGWIDEDRVTAEKLQTTNSIEVFIPDSFPDSIVLEEVTDQLESGSDKIQLNGTSDNILGAYTGFDPETYARNVLAGGTALDAGDALKLEGQKGYVTNAPEAGFRIVDTTEGILLEDGASDIGIQSLFAITLDGTDGDMSNAGDNIEMEADVGGGRLLGQGSDEKSNTKEMLILEGIDGNSGGADVNGYYTIFDASTIEHSGSSSSRLISEEGEGLIDEGSNDPQQNTLSSVKENSVGGEDYVVIDNHQINEEVFIVLDGTDSTIIEPFAKRTDMDGNIILDGESATERLGNTLMQESGKAAGEQDDVVGDNVLHEPEDFLTGNIILNRTDDDDTNAGDNIINEDEEAFVGQTITTTTGASATIIGGKSADVSINTGFISTTIGKYGNTDSLISESEIRIQDSYYYQDFSYEVRVGQSVANYMNELKRAVHPTGFAAFGKVSFATLISATMPNAGAGRIDIPDATFTPELASVLEGVFNLKINQRVGIAKTYEEGNLFQELRLEAGLAVSDLVLDGTNFGTAAESPGFDAIGSEDSEDDGDNILITGSDDGSQEDAGDQIILEGTDADGTNNIDITGEAAYLILNASSVTSGTGEINDAGSYCIMNGSALGVYNLIDASSNSLVLNGTDANGAFYRIIHEDGDHAGSNIVTDSVVGESGVVYSTQSQNLVAEVALGDNILLNGTDIYSADANSKLMSEFAAGVGDLDRENLFLRHLKVKVAPAKPRAFNSVGLSHLVLDSFSDAASVAHIQLEDALRKRGPTINVDRILIDGVDMGEKGDVDDVKFSGEPMQLEESAALNLGTSVKFKDFYRFSNSFITLNGTDGSSTNAGDNIELETNWGGRILEEDELLSFPFNDFLRPDIMVMEGAFDRHSEYGKVVLDGSASDNSTGALDDGSFIILDGIDAMQHGAGDNLIIEEHNDKNKSHDASNDIGILMETHHVEGGAFLREYGGGAVSEGDTIILDGTDGSSTDAEDNFIQEDTPDSRVSQNSGVFVLENNWKIYLLLDGTDSSGTDNGTVIGLEDDSGSLLNELFDGYGTNMLLEEGSTSTKESKLLLDSQVIEIESGINDGEIPTANWGENSVFPSYTAPSEISTKPVGRASLQDESPSTYQSQEGDTGDDLLLDGTRTVGAIALNGTNSSSADEGSPLVLDGTDLGYDRMTLETGSYILQEGVAHGQILIESLFTTIPIENVGGKVLHEDSDHIDAGDFLLISAEILDQAAGGQILLQTGSYIDFEDGTYNSLLGNAPAFLPQGFNAESFDNTTRTTFDSTVQTYDVLEGV